MNDAAAQYRLDSARNTESEAFYFIWCKRLQQAKIQACIKDSKNMAENLCSKKESRQIRLTFSLKPLWFKQLVGINVILDWKPGGVSPRFESAGCARGWVTMNASLPRFCHRVNQQLSETLRDDFQIAWWWRQDERNVKSHEGWSGWTCIRLDCITVDDSHITWSESS